MRILLIEDNQTNLIFLRRLVERIGGMAVAYGSPVEALSDMPGLDYDIAVIDYRMPVLNGIELLKEMARFEKYRNKPAVFVSADADTATRMAALEAGAIDFLTKPVSPLEFQARLRNLMALVDAQNKLADQAGWLRSEVDKAVTQLREREVEIIERLTTAASYKCAETARHTIRVGAYSEAIARAFGLSPEQCYDIRLASPMHDIGKVAIADAILNKNGKLSDEEFTEVKRHTLIGYDILADSKSELLQLAAEIALTHHERWDGRGYPHGTAGAAIPLSGRIVALADNFDALTTVRPYKEAWSVERAVAHIIAQSGTQFDPDCVKAFESVVPECLAIMWENRDDQQAGHPCGLPSQPVCAVAG